MKVKKKECYDEAKNDKVELLKSASSDPIFLEDLKEIAGDFDTVDFEILDTIQFNSLPIVRLS